MPSSREQFRVPLTCPYCEEEGAAIWEEADSGPERKLLALEGRFRAESGRTATGNPIIVCVACDQIQPG